MKIAIVGYGLEGQSAYNYYKKHGHDLTIFDESARPKFELPEDAKTELGPGVLEKLVGFDLVLRGSPAIRPDHIPSGNKVHSVTIEFFDKCPAPIIGITGTKGKGTTSTLIHKMLGASDKTSWLVGNIGQPSLDVLEKIKPEDYVVYELSSFQLWDLQKSPHIAVVLMIEPDHMDVHKDMKEYVSAKSHITKFQHQDDCVIYHPDNHWSAEIAGASRGQKIRYNSPEGARITGDNQIVINEQNICSVNEIALLGEHNLDNVCAAITAVWQIVKDLEAIGSVLRNFKGLDHRLQLVRTIDEVMYVNDSYATTPTAAISAINSFNKPVTVILGGSSKGQDLGLLVDAVTQKDDVRVVCLGKVNGKLIYESLQSAGFSQDRLFTAATLEEAVNTAKETTPSGGVVLLSPAGASFDMFKNATDRGNQFILAVKEL